MKNSLMISALGVLAVVALVTFSNSTAQDAVETKQKPEQIVMRLDGPNAYYMKGDITRSTLPGLLKDGWRIVSMTPIDAGESRGFAYAILEK